jgi:hypothetical protein
MTTLKYICARSRFERVREALSHNQLMVKWMFIAASNIQRQVDSIWLRKSNIVTLYTLRSVQEPTVDKTLMPSSATLRHL